MFAFFADPRNLPPLMPAWQQARIDEITVQPPSTALGGHPQPGQVLAGSGTTLLITARMAPGVPIRLPWLARIEDFTPDDHFCDLQVKGPFAYWHHCHSVRDETRDAISGTVVRDEVVYELPIAPLSKWAVPLGEIAMRGMFGYRQGQAEELVRRFASSRAQERTKQ